MQVLAAVSAGSEPETAVLRASGSDHFNLEQTQAPVVCEPDATGVGQLLCLRPPDRALNARHPVALLPPSRASAEQQLFTRISRP
jgi:hypothetical protein